jgi:hypothetical protein
MSITCKFYRKSEYGRGINFPERIMGIFGEGNFYVYNRRNAETNNGLPLQLKIFFLRENENPQGIMINLVIDYPFKIMNYGKFGEIIYTEKFSEFAPIQFFGDPENYVAILCPKKIAEKAVGVINEILKGPNGEDVLEPCNIRLNNHTLNDEMKRFWVSGIQNIHSKSVSVGGFNLFKKSDYNLQVNKRGGRVGAISLKSRRGNYEYLLSKEGVFWIKSNNMDSHREQIVLETLNKLIDLGIIF